MPNDTASESARQLQAYRKLLALRSAARDLALTASSDSDLSILADLVENLCAERLAPGAGLAEWVTS